MRWTPQWQNYKYRSKAPQRDEYHSLNDEHRQYLFFFTFSIVAASLIFWLPALYLTQQNSSVLTSIYIDKNPSLILGLDQDLLWLQISFVIGVFCIAACSYGVARKVFQRISKPLLAIESKLNLLQDGKTFDISSEKNIDKIYDKFLEYVESVQEERSEQAEILKNINIPVSDKNNYLLIDILKRRLGATPSDVTKFEGKSDVASTSKKLVS